MTSLTIASLANTLPDFVLSQTKLGGKTDFKSEWGFNASVQRFISAYRDMDFGWQYVRACVQHRLPFTGCVLHGADEILFRAYMFCRDPKRYPDPDIEIALALATNQMDVTRATVDGLLLARDSTIQMISSQLKIPAGGVAAYERLFFNVLDRKDDTAYLQSIVYPHGRMVEMVEGYMERTPLSQIIRRAGYNNGKNDVLYLMGASSDAMDAIMRTSTPAQLESLMMTYGFLLARNGGLNQAHAVGLNNAKQLMTAGKLGGETLDDSPLSGDLSAVLDAEISRYARPVAELTPARV